MNRQRNTLDRPTDETRRSPNKMAPMAMAALALMVLLAAYGLAVYGLAVPALAQNEDGAITTLTLTSDTPGEIEISWEAPEPAPSDYRIRWTPDGEAYPSYKDDNQADRGNEYPGGDETSLTLTGLRHGTQYKVQARARYSGGTPPAGPWREATVTVASPEPEPTEEPAPTAEPTPEPTLEPTPEPVPAGTITGLSLASNAEGELTVNWDQAVPEPSDYRVSWTPADQKFLSYRDANQAERGNSYPGGGETSLTLTGLTPGAEYKLKMRARYIAGQYADAPWSGPWSNEARGSILSRPAAPTGLTAGLVGHSVLTLTWDDPQDDSITGYRVLRGTNADSLSAIAEDTGNISTEYTDATVEPETTYHYAVLALSPDGDGPQSGTVSATTPATPRPAAPPGSMLPRSATTA